MGKGSQTTTTNQAQTYSPAPGAASAINGAIQTAQTAAGAPFQAPIAPVAGFSPDQLAAFRTVNNAQGMANPYFTQASNLFNQSAQAPNINQFFNPLAGQVGAQMQNLFGQQMTQATGNLTQAAGGVGADRIAVGQGELANQQALAEGATMAGLYQPALQAAQQEQGILQGAAYGYGALGPAAQNSVLSGAQAQLGTGGLQQQLSQAQLNAPYQQRIAQLAYPFQTSNFLSGTVGSLAPGLGGTSYGMGQTTAPAPSALSQILGLGVAGAGVYGGLGGFSGLGGGLSYSPGVGYYNPGTSAAADAQNDSLQDMGLARGGAANPYHYDDGGDVPDTPIDVRHETYIPQGQIPKIPEHRPNLNLNPPAPQQQQSALGGLGNIVGDVAKIGALFAKDGGSITSQQMRTFDGHNPYKFFRGYDDGGDVPDDLRQTGNAMLRDAMIGHGYTPQVSDQTRAAGMDQLRDAMTEKYGINPNDPIRLDPQATADWKAGVDRDIASGQTAPDTGGLPPEIAAGASHPPANPYADQGLSAYSAPDRSLSSAPPPPEAPERPERDTGFIGSPWAALTAAGLGMMAGTSPFPGVNIGQGGLQGIKMLENQRASEQKDETIDQAAKRLEQEVKFHEDQMKLQHLPYEQMTKAQQAADDRQRARDAQQEWTSAGTVEENGNAHPAIMEKSTGKVIDAVTGKPLSEGANFLAKGAKKPVSPEDAHDVAERYVDTGNRSVLTGLGLSGEARAEVNRQIKKVQTEKGVSNQELGTREAEWEGRKAGQRVLAQQEAKMGSAAFEAENAIGLARGVIERVPRTSILPLNQLIAKAQQNALNPDQIELMGRLQAIKNTYAAVMNRGSSVVTDFARTHADELFNNAYDPPSLNRAFDTALSEIDMAKHSPDRMRRFYRQQYGEKAVGADTGITPAPTSATAPQVGERKQFKQGWGVWNGTTWVPE